MSSLTDSKRASAESGVDFGSQLFRHFPDHIVKTREAFGLTVSEKKTETMRMRETDWKERAKDPSGWYQTVEEGAVNFMIA